MTTLLLVIIYMAFISLGLPDSLFGVSWPLMHIQFGVDVGFASAMTVIISLGTVASSFLSGVVLRKFGTAKVTAVSVLLTALSLLGISFSNSVWLVVAFSIPLGIGAGAVDAGLNSYVAIHYKSRHMSWLHCFWGVGVTASPLIMSRFLAENNWQGGYFTVSIIQFVLAVVLFASLPLWKKVAKFEENKKINSSALALNENNDEKLNATEMEIPDGKTEETDANLSEYQRNECKNEAKEVSCKANQQNCDENNLQSTLQELPNLEQNGDNTLQKEGKKTKRSAVIKQKGVIFALLSFTVYCGFEIILGTWGATFLVNVRSVTPATAAQWVSFYYGGIMIGRLLTGFLTVKLSDKILIRYGIVLVILGAILLALPLSSAFALIGLLLVGCGCAPVFPCSIHATPERFGSSVAPDVIGFQMGFAYFGGSVIQPLFGLIASKTTFAITPYVVVGMAIILLFITEIINVKTRNVNKAQVA